MKMGIKQRFSPLPWHETTAFVLLSLSLLLLPFSLLSNVPLFSLPIFCFLGFDFKKKKDRIKENKTLPFIACCLIFLIIETIGFFTTSNIQTEHSHYTFKVFFFLLPVVLLTLSQNFYSKWRQKVLLYTYLAGGASYVIITGGHAIFQALSHQSFHYLFYTQLSLWKHPTFIAFLLLFSNIILYYSLFFNPSKLSKFKKRSALTLLLLQTGYIVMLQSKTGLAALTLLFILVAIHLYKSWNKWIVLSCIGSFILILGIGIRLIPAEYSRIKPMISILKENTDRANHRVSSTSYRLAALEASLQLIQEKPLLGWGYDGSKKELAQFGRENHIKTVLKPHNQYFQTLLQTGIVGLLSLLSILISAIYVCYQQKRHLIIPILFVGMFLIFNLFESFLDGVTMTMCTFTLLPLILMCTPSKDSNENENPIQK